MPLPTQPHAEAGVRPPTASRNGKSGPSQPIACGTCGAIWTGLAACHCSGQKSILVELLPLGDSDAGVGADWHTHSLKSPPDAGGIAAELLANLVTAHTSAVQQRSLPPPGREVFKGMLVSGQWSQVRVRVVGADVVDVVNVISLGDPAVEDAMFVGFDVVKPANSPAQPDVSMRAGVPTRFVLRNFLAGLQESDGSPVSPISARTAESPLRRTLNKFPTHRARLDDHALIIQVTALCHRTFTGLSAFDIHRVGGQCGDPADIVNQKGEPRLIRAEKQHWSGWGLPGDDTRWEAS